MEKFDYYDNLMIVKNEELEDGTYNVDEIREYIVQLSNSNNWIDKRLSSTFSKNKWLAQYTTKEDIKSDFYVRALGFTSVRGLMKRDKVGRLKYLNRIFSNCLGNIYRTLCGYSLVPITNTLDIAEAYVDEKTLSLIECFREETIERKIVECLSEGRTRDEIMKILDINRRKLDDYIEEIKNVICKEIKEENNNGNN